MNDIDVNLNEANTIENVDGSGENDMFSNISIDTEELDYNEQTIQDTNMFDEEHGNKSSSGNLHIMIIVIVLCAIAGVALGIWRGIKTSNK